jgi:photosystem II stability/assembly factor-like uncharacterized protein
MVVAALLVTSGCDDDDGGDDDGGMTMSTTNPTGDDPTGDDPTGDAPECTIDTDCADGEMCQGGSCVDMFWAVGGDGSVIRVAGDGTAQPHPSMNASLAAIECVGTTDAWIVGDAGFVAQTTDGGASWIEVASGTRKPLRDVEGDHGATVTAVGVDGTWIVSEGAGFRAIVGARGDLEGVALGAAGILAIGGDGTVWAAEPSAALAVEIADVSGQPLAIDLAHDVQRGVIVGRAGGLWWSDDGVSWTARASGTRLDLHAVQIARDGRAAIAVGDTGVVVHIDPSQTRVVSLQDDLDLRDVHLDVRGHGAAVGRDGVIALTHDAGLTFDVFRTGTAPLVGVDALGPVHW